MLAGEPITLEDQLAQWEQRKAAEGTRRLSCVDGIPTGQPALALAQKVIARVTANGLPADLIPAGLRTVVVGDDNDAENELRTAVLEFADVVRMVEGAAAAARITSGDLEQSPLTADEWRAHWP